MKKRLAILAFLLLGGVLVSLAWPPINFLVGPMIGFVPLLLVEQYISSNTKRFRRNQVYWSAFLFFATWFYCGMWWSANAFVPAVLAAVLINSAFFSGVFLLFSQVRKNIGNKIGYLSFVVFLIAWEYIEIIDWDLSWPWLTLGYSLGDHTWAAQWYEFTGSLGGSLWLLLINLAVFKLVLTVVAKREAYLRFRKGLNVFYLIVIPIGISLLLYFNHEEKGAQTEIVVVQPNEDPYKGSFITEQGYNMGSMSRAGKLAWQMRLAAPLISDATSFVLFPESSFPQTVWNDQMDSLPLLIDFYQQAKLLHDVPFLTGVSYSEKFEHDLSKELPFDAHWSNRYKTYYKNHNSALMVNGPGSDSLYNKSLLVIGPERIPWYFVFLQRYMDDFEDDSQGTTVNFNHTIQENRDVFVGKLGKVKIAPIICYESIFGEYVGDYVKNGANVLGIITNDAWWDDTPGYQHHFAYARLRAIETRRAVARSANTGWSGFINQRGDVLLKSEFLKPTALKGKVQLNEELTFYVQHGDFIGRLSIPIAILLLINLFIRVIKKRAKIQV